MLLFPNTFLSIKDSMLLLSTKANIAPRIAERHIGKTEEDLVVPKEKYIPPKTAVVTTKLATATVATKDTILRENAVRSSTRCRIIA